ncbi:hypothetical protein ACTXT7_000113 [Hymenolepis weldensis]
MRGAGCTVNDIIDRDIDVNVKRTKDRPIARGSVSMFNAISFLGLQLTGALAILLQLNLEAILIGGSCVGLVCVYPLFKRFTHFPQVMLGLTMNWGALMGYTAVAGFDWTICFPIYLTGVFQTMLFDSIYSFQDIKYDKQIGVKSMPILLSGTSKWWLYVMAVAMSTSLATAGLTSGSGSVYFAGTGLTMLRIFYSVCLQALTFRSIVRVSLSIFSRLINTQHKLLPLSTSATESPVRTHHTCLWSLRFSLQGAAYNCLLFCPLVVAKIGTR